MKDMNAPKSSADIDGSDCTDAGYSSGSRSDCSEVEENECWGWYEEENDVSSKLKLNNSALREAWFKVSSIIPSRSQQSKNSDSSRTILNIWINPSPEVSIKLSSGSGIRSLADSMSMSCCVSGFRIAQLSDGECCAEFLTIFCYGSRSYSTWKTLNEFKELAKVVCYIRSLDDKLFSQTIKAWEIVSKHMKWTRCLRAKYLIEMSITLGTFIQSLFSESPTPGLLLCFIQSSNFLAI
jgi:hypothetical protein